MIHYSWILAGVVAGWWWGFLITLPWRKEEGKGLNRETGLQNQIIVALCERGCYAVNHTVGDFYTKYGGRVSVGVPGESDIWGHRPDGKAFYIEVKRPGETPRQNQLDFIEAMKSTGAIAGWCTSVDEALRIVEVR